MILFLVWLSPLILPLARIDSFSITPRSNIAGGQYPVSRMAALKWSIRLCRKAKIGQQISKLQTHKLKLTLTLRGASQSDSGAARLPGCRAPGEIRPWGLGHTYDIPRTLDNNDVPT